MENVFGFTETIRNVIIQAEIAYKKNRNKPGITDVELGDLVQKMEYARAVHKLMIQNYGGK